MAFVMKFISNGSAPTKAALAYEQTIYADTVDYYGKPASRAAVIQDKKRYLNEWTVRSNTLVPGSAIIRCEADSSVYIFTGHMNYANTNSKKHTSGVTSLILGIKVSKPSGRMTVVQESSKVIVRSQ